MTSASTETGNEVLAYCGSCKIDLAAIIVAKVGAKIARVQCKTCKKEHAYKAPKGATEPKAAKSKSRKKSAEEEAAAKSTSIAAEWQRLMNESAKANKLKYTPKAKLQLGDVIDHPTFGQGVVMRLSHPDKAEILFKDNLRMLIHSR